MAPGSTFSRNLGVRAPFRFNARIWIASRTSDNFPSVRVGNTAAAVFSELSQYRVAEWQILEVLISGDKAAATLDGDTFPLAGSTGRPSTAAIFTSGQTTVYVDDIFVTPL